MRRKFRAADTWKQLCADIRPSSIQEGYEGRISAQQLSELMEMDRAHINKKQNQFFQEDADIKNAKGLFDRNLLRIANFYDSVLYSTAGSARLLGAVICIK